MRSKEVLRTWPQLRQKLARASANRVRHTPEYTISRQLRCRASQARRAFGMRGWLTRARSRCRFVFGPGFSPSDNGSHALLSRDSNRADNRAATEPGRHVETSPSLVAQSAATRISNLQLKPGRVVRRSRLATEPINHP